MTADVVLVAHHDETVRARARDLLVQHGVMVDEAARWALMLREIARVQPDVLVVAAQLDDTDVLDHLAEPRNCGVRGVVVLTDDDDRDAGARALDAGADDYVSESLISRDLAVRVRALLRRISPPALQQLEYGELTIDRAAREVRVDGRVIELTTREFDLLVFLASHPRVVYTREELLEHVWRTTPEWQGVATVTEHVRRIRQKLDDDEGRWLATVRGAGYKFRP